MGIIGDREEAKRNEFQATLDAAERRDYEKRVSENNEKMRSLQETIKNLTTNWNVKIAYKVNLIQTTPALLLDVEVIAPGIEKPYKLRQLSEIIVVPVNNSADQIEVTLMETSKKPDSNEYDFVGHRFWLRKDESGKVTSL